ncbi:MAG: ArsR/SmtB family transcription factor [Brevirhabdus sp.]
MEQEDLLENSAKASRLLRVMSNEKRLIILCNLVKGELSVQQLQERTGFGQSTVSQQLATLRAERIVTYRREAQSVFYGLNSEEAGKILETLYGIYCDEPE